MTPETELNKFITNQVNPLLQAVWGSTNGHFRMFNDSIKGPGINLSGEFSDNIQYMMQMNAQGHGVFFIPNTGGQKDEDINKINSLYIDYDASTPPPPFHKTPSIIIRRGDKFHAYWLLTDNITSEQFRAYQKRLINYYGSDKQIHNPSRVMRLPGFNHMKIPDNPTQYKIEYCIELVKYTSAQLMEGLPELPQQALQINSANENAVIDETYKNIQRLIIYISKMPEAIEGEEGDAQTLQIFSYCRDYGLSPEKALDVVLTYYNPRCIPPWPEKELIKICNNAYKYAKGIQGSKSLRVISDLNDPDILFPHNPDEVAPSAMSLVPIEPVKTPVIIDESIANMTWTNDFLMTDEEMNKISDPEWMYKDLIIKGHLSAVVAPPNGGKTTILMNIAGQMPDSKVYYVNADVSGVDAKRYYYQAKKNNFTLLLPDMKPGLSMLDVVKNLEQMNHVNRDYSDTLFIFDTLKKMADVIDKRQSKSLYRTLRGLSAKGMTIVLLGHTNKYKDSDGNYIYEGTGDLRSDLDELIYLIPQKHDDGSLTVSTQPDKVRGEFKPITFEISKERQVSQINYVNTIKENKWQNQYEKDEHIISAIYSTLQIGKNIQIDIIKYCHEKYSIGNKSTKRVLDYFSEGGSKLWIAERKAEFNKITYRQNLDNE